jgi:P27 family predicted phage terminase small subunit
MSHHTRGRKAESKQVPDALISVPSPPSALTKEAKGEWRRVMSALISRRVLTNADVGAVERYCEAVGDVSIARATITKDGAYMPNRLGELKRHPAFSTLREATGEARRWAAELGLTPASRSRVGSSSEDTNSAGSKLDL